MSNRILTFAVSSVIALAATASGPGYDSMSAPRELMTQVTPVAPQPAVNGSAAEVRDAASQAARAT